jgi:DNA-binding transcriptional regulator/RsmH inhibitor MraZ
VPNLVILRVLLKGCVFIGSDIEIWDKDLYEKSIDGEDVDFAQI